MIHSILQIIVFQFLFLAVYDLFLKQESFFGLNRAYLLLTPALGIILAFISLSFIQQIFPQEYLVQLPSVMLGESASETGSAVVLWWQILKSVWILGMLISGLILSSKVYKIIKLKSEGASKRVEGIKFTILPNTDIAFSFFTRIYVGEKISEENMKSIIAHEKVHVKQMHSLDLLYFELLRIVFWFNPLVYLYQNRISTLHEFIADAEVVNYKSKKKYYQDLLSEVFQTSEISFVNSFFKQSIIKNRILMLRKSNSPKIKLMKYLLLLPILGVILTYTSCSGAIKNVQQEQQQISNPTLPPPPPPTPPTSPNSRADNENDVVAFAIIEKVPVYPGCTGDNLELKTCMSTKMAEFVGENFNTDIVKGLELSGRQRINVQFAIDKTGKVVDVRSRGPHANLEAEAIRVVEMFPEMQPGEEKGEKVGVLYSLPIVFDVKE